MPGDRRGARSLTDNFVRYSRHRAAFDEEADFIEAEQRFYVALRALAGGDAEPLKSVLSQADDATMFLGWGGYEVGWEQIRERWEWAATRFAGRLTGGQGSSVETLSRAVSGDLAYTTAIERKRSASPAGKSRSRWRIGSRTSTAARMASGVWPTATPTRSRPGSEAADLIFRHPLIASSPGVPTPRAPACWGVWRYRGNGDVRAR